MGAVVSLLLPLIGKIKLFGFAISDIIAWSQTDQGKAAIGVAQGVVKKLIAGGDPQITAVLKFLAMVAKIHPMTPAEEKIWADRASDAGAGGG